MWQTIRTLAKYLPLYRNEYVMKSRLELDPRLIIFAKALYISFVINNIHSYLREKLIFFYQVQEIDEWLIRWINQSLIINMKKI